MSSRWVVGFNRDRDGYELAAALAEVGALGRLVTDYYVGAGRLQVSSLAHRFNRLIPSSVVDVVPLAVVAQAGYAVLRHFRPNLDFPSALVDPLISRAICRAERHTGGDMLVYSGYAGVPFRRFPDVRRVLFQFHPSRSIIALALEADEYPGRWYQEPEMRRRRKERTYRRELASASEYLCASTFTATGLMLDGVPGDKIKIVPYGCPEPAGDVVLDRDPVFLFVGQGVQRKGLHLLLRAWQEVADPNWTLRLVCSRIDPEIRSLSESVARVELSGSVSREELERLMRCADTLVLPSLVEGFGLVLGEALASGCRIIASSNTGAVDMALSPDVATIVAAGSIAELREALAANISSPSSLSSTALSAVRSARSRSWAHFRLGIRDALGIGQGA